MSGYEKNYRFDFNGNTNSGFIISSGNDTPYSYSAQRYDEKWVVDFIVTYAAVTGKNEYNTSTDIPYTITAFEGSTQLFTTDAGWKGKGSKEADEGVVRYGNRRFVCHSDSEKDDKPNGRTYCFYYNESMSTWTTIGEVEGRTITVTLDLGKTYYGLNKFSITTLDGDGHNYTAPKSVLFQVSDDNVNWRNVAYARKNSDNDKNYYRHYQEGLNYAYNYFVNVEGVAARYVRAVLETTPSSSTSEGSKNNRTAIQEFWVNALQEPTKVSGGNSAVADFDYKMLWDDKNLYIAFQYEEDEVPFYTANHQYFETYTMEYDSKYYKNGTASAEKALNAFSISNLGYDPQTGKFQLAHAISQDDYSGDRINEFKLYKVSSIGWNNGNGGKFTYGNATVATSIATTDIVEGTNSNGKTLASTSQLNGYIVVQNGYALSQKIDGYTLKATPITVNNNTIPANQIADDLVWYFEDTADLSVDIMTAAAKALGEWNVFSFYRGVVDDDIIDAYYFDDVSNMAYTPYYLTRASQGELWENVYTFARDCEQNDIRRVNTDGNRAQTPTDTKGMDVVIDTETYTIFKYTLAFARDGELAQQILDKQYVKIVAETDGGEDGWICLTEVEVFEGHTCYPVYDLTESKYKKNALNAADDQKGEVRPTFFRGYYDSDLYYNELSPSGEYNAKHVFNKNESEADTTGYVFGNVEQRAVDGRGVPYFYEGDQLLLRVTTDQLNCDGYNYGGDWVSNYKLLAESKIYYTSVGAESSYKTRLFTTTAVPTPTTRCDILARDKVTCELPDGYNGENSYYYLPIYLMNSLEYLKDYGYHNKTGTQNYIYMPSNKVELSGELVWDTNYEQEDGDYVDDKNGVSLNLAPLGAKTNTDEVQYNSKMYKEETSLRFGSIWYIDDTAYYNTHTHMQQYGTLLMTIGNLGKYFTDKFAATSKYKSVFDDYGVELTMKDGKYVSTTGKEYTDVITLVDGTGKEVYWGADTDAAFEMLQTVSTMVGDATTDETKVMAALDVFLEYINVHGKGELVQNENYEDFGGIAMHSRANKYYYFSNISTKLVPEKYDDKYDSTPDKQNQTDLLGVYNYDQRYLEFDAIIAGIPESQKGNKIVAVPYIIYANNYEFLEFGEHLGTGDEHVESTWQDVYNKYYGGEFAENNLRRYVYGGGIARSINDVLTSQK